MPELDGLAAAAGAHRTRPGPPCRRDHGDRRSRPDRAIGRDRRRRVPDEAGRHAGARGCDFARRGSPRRARGAAGRGGPDEAGARGAKDHRARQRPADEGSCSPRARCVPTARSSRRESGICGSSTWRARSSSSRTSWNRRQRRNSALLKQIRPQRRHAAGLGWPGGRCGDLRGVEPRTAACRRDGARSRLHPGGCGLRQDDDDHAADRKPGRHGCFLSRPDPCRHLHGQGSARDAEPLGTARRRRRPRAGRFIRPRSPSCAGSAASRPGGSSPPKL